MMKIDLQPSFSIKYLGEISYHMRCYITRNWRARMVIFDQRQYPQTVADHR